MPIISEGVMDTNIRVQYAALDALGVLMEVLAPTVQVKYHESITPKLIELLQANTHLKLKTQATLTMLNFCNGLLNSSEDDEEGEDHCSIIDGYWTKILIVLRGNLN